MHGNWATLYVFMRIFLKTLPSLAFHHWNRNWQFHVWNYAPPNFSLNSYNPCSQSSTGLRLLKYITPQWLFPGFRLHHFYLKLLLEMECHRYKPFYIETSQNSSDLMDNFLRWKRPTWTLMLTEMWLLKPASQFEKYLKEDIKPVTVI